MKIITFIIVIQVSITNLRVHAQQDTSEFLYTSTIVYTNRGNETIKLEESHRTFSALMNTTWQTAYLLDINQPYTRKVDSDGNPSLQIHSISLPPDEKVQIVLFFKIIKRDRIVPNISYIDSGNLSDVSDELLQEYGSAESLWRTDDQTLIYLARSIANSTENTTNVLKIVCALADWIGNNVSPVSHEFPYYPNETYYSLMGDCDDQANLLITLCRILGIPAYLQIGGIYRSERGLANIWEGHRIIFLQHIAYHAWAVVYIPPWGWLPVDIPLGWTQSNSLNCITLSTAYNTSTVIFKNIKRSDWPGEVRKQQEILFNNSLYVYNEEKLGINSDKSLFQTSQWYKRIGQSVALISWITMFVILVYFFRSTGYITRMPELENTQ